MGLSIYSVLKGKTEKYQPISEIVQDVLTYKILPDLNLKELNEFALTGKQQISEVNRYLTKLYGSQNKEEREEEQKIANMILQLTNLNKNKEDEFYNQMIQRRSQILEKMKKDNQVELSTVNKMMYFYQTEPSKEGEKFLRMLEEIFNTLGANFVSLKDTKDKGKILMVDYSNLPFVFSMSTRRDKTLPMGLRVGINPYLPPEDPENKVFIGIVEKSPEIWWELDENISEKYKQISNSINDVIIKYYQQIESPIFSPYFKGIYGTNWEFLRTKYSTNIKMAYPNEGYNLFHNQFFGINEKE